MDISQARARSAFRLALAGLLATVVIGATACGGESARPSGAGEKDRGPAVSADPITVLMKDNFFEPKELTVPVGKAVKITAKNEGIAIHNMQVLSKEAEGKNFESSTIVNPGAASTFEVKFTKPGTYKFQCIYHLPDMVGTITVK